MTALVDGLLCTLFIAETSKVLGFDLLDNKRPCLQTEGMRLFFQNVDPSYVATISRHSPNSDVCDGPGNYPWEYMTCSDGLLREVRSAHADRGNYSLEFLPGSVRTLLIPFCSQSYEISTRMLPRELRALNVRFNNICGTFDLRTLPAMSREIRADNNEICGIVNLIQLPDSMQIISLTGNNISHVIFYDDLPACLRSIDFEENPIAAIRPVRRRHSAHTEGIHVKGLCLYTEKFVSKG